MTIEEFNQLHVGSKKELLQKCCGSSSWIDKMLAAWPFENLSQMLKAAEVNWYACNEQDWLEAFQHHPKIGDINSLKEKYASTAAWASNEQSGVNAASNKILEELSAGNDVYENKFGYIFIVCATGKSAAEMLEILNSRLPHNSEEEIKIAAEEQNKITKVRLAKLFV